jgi:glutamyl-tRNA reductase
MSKRSTEILLIDIANPRDIDETATEIDGVKLFNIDSLRSVSERNLAKRKNEIPKVNIIIEEEMELLKTYYKRQRADQIISAMYSRMDEIRCRERDAAINKLKAWHTVGEVEHNVLDDLSHSVANKILAEPTKILRNAAEHDNEEFLDTAAVLFGLNNGSNNNNKNE